MEKMPENFIWLALALSNLAALLTLLAAWKKPGIARLLYFLLFAWAAWANTRVATMRPDAYLEYADFAVLPFYKTFILGWFKVYGQVMVFCIAAGQAFIAFAMLGKGWLFKLGCIGGIVFLMGISPLGVGAGFPSPLIWAFGLYLLYKEHISQTLWAAFLAKRTKATISSWPNT